MVKVIECPQASSASDGSTRINRWNKVRALQYLLTHSFYAKLLAVKRVISDKGKKTPGIDGVLWQGARAKWRAACSLRRRGYHPQPLRRIYIEKKNGKLRPLSIPTMYDRAQQALYKQGLAPIAETTADKNSYGFREGRACAATPAHATPTASREIREMADQALLVGRCKECVCRNGQDCQDRKETLPGPASQCHWDSKNGNNRCSVEPGRSRGCAQARDPTLRPGF